MLKRKYLLLEVFLTLFFIAISLTTTFRLALYAFIICYITVIIAKAKNKRLKVPVVRFFMITFAVSIFFAVIYAFSPRIQFYEFKLLHNKWEVFEVKDIEKVSPLENIYLKEPFLVIGERIQTKLVFENKEGVKSKMVYNFDDFHLNLLDVTLAHTKHDVLLDEEIAYLNAHQDLYIFKKPNQKVYKVYSQHLLFVTHHSLANFVCTIFMALAFLICFFGFLFNFREIMSTLLSRYPKNNFLIYMAIVFFLIICSVLVIIAII